MSEIAPAVRFEPGSARYDVEGRLFRFNAADTAGRFTCVMPHANFKNLTGVHVDAENARHLFADWEQVVFKAAEERYAAFGRTSSEGLLIEPEPASV